MSKLLSNRRGRPSPGTCKQGYGAVLEVYVAGASVSDRVLERLRMLADIEDADGADDGKEWCVGGTETRMMTVSGSASIINLGQSPRASAAVHNFGGGGVIFNVTEQ